MSHSLINSETANYAAYPQRMIGRVANFSMRSDNGTTLSGVGSNPNYNEPTYFSTTGASTPPDRLSSGGLSDVASTRRRIFLDRCREQYVRVAASEYIEYGFSSASEQLLSTFAEKYPAMFGDIVQHIFIEESTNSKILVALLKAVATYKYNSVYPYAQTMAIAALANALPDVREAGIRAFESWEHPEGIRALESAAIPWAWLEDYRRQTIEYLKEFR